MRLKDILWPWGALSEARDVAERLHDENRQLYAEIREGHWRNPKTGRLGHKGQRFMRKVRL